MRSVVSLKNNFFCFISTVLSKIVGYWYFLKNTPQMAEWYWNPCWCTVSIKISQVQVIQVIYIDQCSYSASKCCIFEGYLQFYQIKHKIFSLFSLKLMQMSAYYLKLFEHVLHIKNKKIKLSRRVSIKRNIRFVHWSTSLFLKTNYN